jgi:hypothetical protein
VQGVKSAECSGSENARLRGVVTADVKHFVRVSFPMFSIFEETGNNTTSGAGLPTPIDDPSGLPGFVLWDVPPSEKHGAAGSLAD